MSIVLENNFQRIAGLASEHETHDADMLPLGFAWLQGRERAVRVLPVDCFPVDLADVASIIFDENVRMVVVRLARHVVRLGRRVIPINLIGRDEIGSDLTAGLDSDFLRPTEQSSYQGNKRKEKTVDRSHTIQLPLSLLVSQFRTKRSG
jgi:hypothetical protein